MPNKVGDTISIEGKITIKDEIRKDNKKSKLICIPYENDKMYARVMSDADKQLFELISKNIESGNMVTITGEVKGIAGVDGAKVNFMSIDTIALNDNESNFNKSRVIREDAKNTFVEVMADAFNIDKIKINFFKYDLTKAQGQRYTANIPIYLSVDDADMFAENILNGHYLSLIKAQKLQKEKGAIQYYSPVEEFYGGVSAKKLAERGQSREDGKALSRVLSIDVSTSNNFMFVLTAQSGPGIETSNHGISPDKKNFESKVQVPLTMKAAQRFALAIRRAIWANEIAKATVNEIKEREDI